MTLSRRKRVLNSAPCNISDHPYMVSITSPHWTRNRHNVTYNYYISLTGVLITLEYFLTYRSYFDDIDDTFKIKAGMTYELSPVRGEIASISNYSQQWRFEEEPGRFVFGEPDNLGLVQFQPPFNESAQIQPVKLPPSREFLDSCDKLLIVGWGITNKHRRNLDYRESAGEIGNSLRCSEAKLTLCNEDSITDSTRFCFEMLDGRLICRNDFGQAVMCRGILVGITQKHENNEDCTKGGLASNLSHYTKWFHARTGVNVSFEGVPDRKWKPRTKKNTSKHKSIAIMGSKQIGILLKLSVLLASYFVHWFYVEL